LINNGYVVPSVVSMGETAIEKVKEDKPDLILMDIMLAGKMDGIETADMIHTKFNIPVIYLTAYSDDKILERAKITGPFGYLIKPFKDRELYVAVEMSLYKYKLEMELKESKEFYEGILEGIVTGVWVTDINDGIIYSNKGMKAIFPELTTGVKVMITWEFFKPYYMRAKETREPFHYEGVPFVITGKSPKYYSGWLIPRIDDKEFKGMICTVENIHTQA
jgi:CheY-like chemotaxis protein